MARTSSTTCLVTVWLVLEGVDGRMRQPVSPTSVLVDFQVTKTLEPPLLNQRLPIMDTARCSLLWPIQQTKACLQALGQPCPTRGNRTRTRLHSRVCHMSFSTLLSCTGLAVQPTDTPSFATGELHDISPTPTPIRLATQPTNPALGVSARPHFSWAVPACSNSTNGSDVDHVQTAYRIVLYVARKNQHLQTSTRCVHCLMGNPLSP
jgi:hypothetical protein